MKLRRWRTTEEALLRRFYSAIGAEACAAMLERSASSVYNRAYRLRLTESDPRKAQRFNAR